MMTQLRERMKADLQLRGLAERTQEAYIRAVRQLAGYYDKSPDLLSEEEVRQYFLYLKNEKQASKSSQSVAIYGIRFFYEQTLQQEWPLFRLIRVPKEKKLPIVLSQAEVYQILTQLNQPAYRMCLTVIYGCGLRIGEACRLKVGDVDSDRGWLLIEQGKGRKDRYVPLPESIVPPLRRYWLTHRHRTWVFPARPDRGKSPDSVVSHRHPSGVQRAFRLGLKASGVSKKAVVHTLRHSWATHLLEAGVNIRQIQQWMGHQSIQTTTQYTHLTETATKNATEIVNEVMAGLPE